MNRLRKILAAIEPWYQWGKCSCVSLRDERDFDGRFLILEWLNFQINIQVGRAPANKEK